MSSLTIAEAAEQTGLTTHTLRYYERDGLMLGSVERSSSGHRRYSERDLTWIEMITRLRSTGMPMRDVRRYAELVRAGDGNELERLDLLVGHRDRVERQLAEVTSTCARSTTRSGSTRESWSARPDPLTSSALEGVGWVA